MSPDIHRSRFLLDLIKRMHAADPGPAPLTSALTTTTAPAGEGAAERVPLPLTVEIWTERILERQVREEDLARAIVDDRRAALMYVALASLPEPTLTFLAVRPALLTRLAREHAPVFASVARSLRVEGDAIAVPGGTDAIAAWEALVGERAGSPEQFILALLGRDDGRLAVFFDSLTLLPLERQRFALTPASADESRSAALARLYRATLRIEPAWTPALRPFVRPASDLEILLHGVKLDASGEMAEPSGRALWRAVLRGRRDRSPLPADAAFLAERMLVTDRHERAANLQRLFFAQRLGTKDEPDALRQVLAALPRYPALVTSLERIGVRDVRLYARAVECARAADAIARDADRDRVLAALQGSLALLERLAAVGALDSRALERHTATLLELVPADGTRYSRHIARWLRDSVVPRVAARLPTGVAELGAERVLLEGLAGAAASPSDSPSTVHWEGSRYRIDPAGAELTRLEDVRAHQGVPLDVALDLVLAAAELSPDEKASLATLIDAIDRARSAYAADRDVPPSLQTALDLASEAARAASSSAGARSIAFERAAAASADAGSAVLADTLVAWAYAPNLGDTTGRAFLAGSVARRHRFGSVLPGAPASIARGAWAYPVERSGQGLPWHVEGALCGLDLALARLSLRRVSGEMPTRAPTLVDSDRQVLYSLVALLLPTSPSDADGAAIASAVRAGRARLESLRTTADIDRLAGLAGLNGWRRALLPWALDHDRDAVRYWFSLPELAAIGLDGKPVPLESPALWGTPSAPFDGCPCLAVPPLGAEAWREGRAATGLLATVVPDLTWRLAELLAEAGLPGRVLPSVLTAAMQDLVDEAQMAHRDDWLSLVQQAQQLDRARVDDYVAGLTVRGPLVPESPPGHMSPLP